MSATVAAALKKIAVAILSDPKLLKKILAVILVIIIAIISPILAVVAVMNQDVNIDNDTLKTLVIQNLSDDEKEKLQFLENTMYSIENKMTDAGYSVTKAKEAQVLYVLALSDFSYKSDFVDKLVGCFETEQTDNELIASINTTFGISLVTDDFSKVMNGIRSVYIDTSEYTDPSTKNNLDLVIWANNAYKSGWGYVYGTYGTVLNESILKIKASQYPDYVGNNEDFIRQNWLGRRTADCVGLIKGYSWYNAENQKTEIGSNGMPDISANQMYENATEKGTIDTMPDILGIAVWHKGHIGIYIGEGNVIEAMGTKYGVVKTNLSGSQWTHWLKIPYITYTE